MKSKDILPLGRQELMKLREETSKASFNLKMQKAMGHSVKHHQFRSFKRLVARINTQLARIEKE